MPDAQRLGLLTEGLVVEMKYEDKMTFRPNFTIAASGRLTLRLRIGVFIMSLGAKIARSGGVVVSVKEVK